MTRPGKGRAGQERKGRTWACLKISALISGSCLYHTVSHVWLDFFFLSSSPLATISSLALVRASHRVV